MAPYRREQRVLVARTTVLSVIVLGLSMNVKQKLGIINENI